MTRVGNGSFDVDVSSETLARTTLGERKIGDGVNLEKALRVDDRLGGHLVSGHVDGIDDSCIAHGLPKKESERWNSLPKVYLAPE